MQNLKTVQNTNTIQNTNLQSIIQTRSIIQTLFKITLQYIVYIQNSLTIYCIYTDYNHTIQTGELRQESNHRGENIHKVK